MEKKKRKGQAAIVLSSEIGTQEEQWAAYLKAEKHLNLNGYIVRRQSRAYQDSDDESVNDILKFAELLAMLSRMDTVCFLSGWEQSTELVLLHDILALYGMEIILWEDA